jgi:hypothetical protein
MIYSSLENKLFDFFLMVKEEHIISDISTRKIVCFFKEIFDFYMESMATLVLGFTSHSGLNVDTAYQLISFMDITSLLNKISSAFNSTSNLTAHFSKNNTLSFTKPSTYSLPDDSIVNYVPLRSQLENLLKNEFFFNQLYFDDNNDNYGKLKSQFFETRYFFYLKNLFGSGNIYLKIYMDELLVVNPIGAAKANSSYKFLTIYFQILNCFDQSKLSSIFLYAIISYKIVKLHGYCVILDHLVTELNDLFRSSLVGCDNIERRVVTSFFCGDNLSMHELSGIQRYFVSGYICRHCYYTTNSPKEDIVLRNYSGLVKDIAQFESSRESTHGLK